MSAAESFFNDLPDPDPEARLGIPRHKGKRSDPWIRHADDPNPAPPIRFDAHQPTPRWVLVDNAPRRGSFFIRASSFGKPLKDMQQINDSRERKIVRGMARSPGLQMQALAVLDPSSREGRDELEEIAEKAAKLEQIDDAATRGTAGHKLLEHHDAGEALTHIPSNIRAMVTKWSELTSLFRMVGMEGFVVCREYGTAGSYDRVAEVLKPVMIWWPDEETKQIRSYVLEPGQRVIIDLKTGKWGSRYFDSGYGCQGWIYPNSTPYTHTNGEGQWPDGITPNTDWSLIVELNPDKLDEAGLHWVNLRVAKEHMDAAVLVRRMRKARTLFIPHQELSPPVPVTEAELLSWIPLATVQADLNGLHAAHPELWTPAVHEAATRRWHELAVA